MQKLGEWGRYKDVDGDGIPYRTVPGDGMPAYFTRGSGHNAKGQYSERPDDYVENMDRLARKFETARDVRAASRSIDEAPGAKIGFIGYGTSHWAITESRDQLREETDVKTSYFRLRAYPFTEELAAFIDAHERVYVVEQNRDAQLLQLMRLELTPERHREAAQRPALQRPADRRAQHHRRRAGAGRLRGGEEDVRSRPVQRRRVAAPSN